MAVNDFIVNLVAGLSKTKSKQQIKSDAKSLGDMKFVKLIGNLDMPKTRKAIKSQLKGLNNLTFNITPNVNTKGVQTATKQAINNAQRVANSNKVHLNFDTSKQQLVNQIKILGRNNNKLFNNHEMTAKYNQLLNAANVAKSTGELKTLINPNIIVLDTYINSHTPINHKCLICGNKWKTKPNSILFNKTGCPKCNESKGEREIRLWLDKHNIIYETQKSFDDCRDQRTLPFDFYLSEQNKIIEFDGEQHYKPISFFGGQPGFEKRQKHDIIKDNFCKSKGINLLRIPYNKNIEEELDNFLFN